MLFRSAPSSGSSPTPTPSATPTETPTPTITPTDTPIDFQESDSLYLENNEIPVVLKDENGPNEVTYEDPTPKKDFIEIIRPINKIIQRNVGNSKRRGFR